MGGTKLRDWIGLLYNPAGSLLPSFVWTQRWTQTWHKKSKKKEQWVEENWAMGLSSTRTSSRADSVRPSCHYAVGGRDIVLVNRTRYARFFLRTGVGLEIGGRERPFVPAVFLLVNCFGCNFWLAGNRWEGHFVPVFFQFLPALQRRWTKNERVLMR